MTEPIARLPNSIYYSPARPTGRVGLLIHSYGCTPASTVESTVICKRGTIPTVLIGAVNLKNAYVLWQILGVPRTHLPAMPDDP